MNKLLLALVSLLAAGLPLLAQNTAGTGSISGVVQDTTGAVIPDAKVVVENLAKGIRRELTTTEGGVFSAPALIPAGGYQVTITKQGFGTYEAREVQVQVGETVSLKPVLNVASAATQVEVTSEAPIIESEKSDVSGVVTSRQILDLPTITRRVDTFVLLQPGVTSDGPFGLLTFRGNPGGNAFLTDGVDTTNQFYDENAGRTRTFNISQDSVQEFQVITSNFLAEYGRASGGVVNTITRSGTNDYHGSAYWFFRNRTLNATDITTNGVNPQDWRHQAGVSVGGPIKKDKLFFFFNGELTRRYNPVYSANLTTNEFVSITTPVFKAGICNAPATPAQCSAAENYILSRAQPQLIPRSFDVNTLFGKIDYQFNDANRLTFELNYLDFRSPNGIQTQLALTNGNAIGNNANTNVFDRTGKIGLTTVVSPNAVNEMRFGFFKDRQYDPNSPSLLPPIGPIGLSIGGSTGISNIGYSTGYNRLDPSEQRFQIADTLSYTAGKHSMKFGIDYANTEDFVKLLRNPYGTYSYASLTNFALDFSGNTTGAKNWSSFSQNFGNPVVDTYLNEVAGFIQDQWHLTPRLTLEPGIRYEHTVLPQPPQTNPAFPSTGTIPETKLNFAPRFGIAYNVNDKTVIRGGFGIFYNRYVSATVSNFFSNNGLYQTQYALQGTQASQRAVGPVFPNSLAAPPSAGSASSSLAFADPGFRNAYSEQADIAIERQITRDSSLTVSYVWDRGLHLLTARDANIGNPTGIYTYPILSASGTQIGSFTTPIYTLGSRINKAFNAPIILVDSGGDTWYNGLLVNYKKRFSSWFQGDASYTYSHTLDENIGGGGNTLFTPSSPTSVLNGNYSGERGSASTDQRHRLVVNAVLQPVLAKGNSVADRYLINNWQLSAISTFASALPLTPFISVGPSLSSTLAGGGGLYRNGTIDGLGGSNRVPFESTSLLDIDQLYRTDARLTKILPISERFRVQLIFEATNVFNHPFLQGTSARVAQQFSTVSYNGGIALQQNPGFGGGPFNTSAPIEGTTARRAQAALRIDF